MHENFVNACGSAVTQHILTYAISHSKLHWAMRFAQVAALEMDGLRKFSVIETDMNTDLVKELMEKPVSFTLMGLPVRIDEKMYPSQISLYEGEREIVRIENLAIPSGFAVA